jgi:hypothetical protein
LEGIGVSWPPPWPNSPSATSTSSCQARLPAPSRPATDCASAPDV